MEPSDQSTTVDDALVQIQAARNKTALALSTLAKVYAERRSQQLLNALNQLSNAEQQLEHAEQQAANVRI